MKLAALGLVAVVIGALRSTPGLVAIGVYWIALGPIVRAHGLKVKNLLQQSKNVQDKRAVLRNRSIFVTSTVLFLAIGVPSLLVGVMKLGIDADDAWRWLPIIVGAVATYFAVSAGVMYLVGAVVESRSGPPPTTPATVWILAMEETGVFVNERPRLEFVFRVEPDAGGPMATYEVTKKATVPFTALGSLRVGDGFRAKVAGADNPTSMDIAWDEAVRG